MYKRLLSYYFAELVITFMPECSTSVLGEVKDFLGGARYYAYLKIIASEMLFARFLSEGRGKECV